MKFTGKYLFLLPNIHSWHFAVTVGDSCSYYLRRFKTISLKWLGCRQA